MGEIQQEVEDYVARFARSSARFYSVVLHYAVPDVKECLDYVKATGDTELLDWLYKESIVTKINMIQYDLLGHAIKNDHVELAVALRLSYGYKSSAVRLTNGGFGSSMPYTAQAVIIKASLAMRRELWHGYKLTKEDIVEAFAPPGRINPQCLCTEKYKCASCREEQCCHTAEAQKWINVLKLKTD